MGSQGLVVEYHDARGERSIQRTARLGSFWLGTIGE